MSFSRLKSWAAAGAVAAVVIAGAGCGSIPFLSGPPPNAPAPVPDPAPPPSTEVAVNGSLVFPRRVEVSFDISGEVEEVLVEEGNVVAAGQVLARLDSMVVIALEQQLSEAALQMDRTQESLDRAKLNYDMLPLEDAQRRRNIAQAVKDIADAEELISDYLYDISDLAVKAEAAKMNADLALAGAEDRLADYQRDFQRQNELKISGIKTLVSAKELEIEQAQRRLGNLNIEYDELEANGMVNFQLAEDAVETVEDDLTAFLRNPIPDYDNRKPIDLELLERIRTRQHQAETNLRIAEKALADLETNRELQIEQLESAISLAQSEIATAREDLNQLENFVDLDLDLRRLQTAVDNARLALDDAEHDLEEALEGPDQDLLDVMERSVELAEERLEDLEEEPELLEIEVLEDTLVSIQARIDEIHEDLERIDLRAPIAGIVGLVNVEEDDLISRDSRVLEIVDPSVVVVDGLIDANDIGLVRLDSPARVNIESVPGYALSGAVTRLASEPRTERGVVSYPVRIAVEVPEGVEVPVRLSAVSAVIPVSQ
jgi:multidrug efflux pump subunit AcrA (membrane-fusion protein)